MIKLSTRFRLISWVVVCFVSVGCSIGETYIDPQRVVLEPDLDRGGVVASVILIGDAGDAVGDEEDQAVLSLLRNEIGITGAKKTLVVFLGDNIYPTGMREGALDGYFGDDVDRLRLQLDTVREAGAQALFIPGNHDYGAGGIAGVRRQAEFIDAYRDRHGTDVRFLPNGEGGGPEAMEFPPEESPDQSIRIVVLDTQSWILDAGDVYPTREDLRRELEGKLAHLIDRTEGRPVIVVGHHPIATHGPHGGFFPGYVHLFPLTVAAPWAWIPLPIIGTGYVVARNAGVSNTDLSHGGYAMFAAALDSIFEEHRPTLFAAGHEHSLQWLEGPAGVPYAVSGAGSPSKLTPLYAAEDTMLASPLPGCMRVDLMSDGRVALETIAIDDGEVERYAMWIRR